MELKDKPLIAILLIGFVPSISVIFGIKIIEDEFYSQIFFGLCKAWIFLVPTIWYLRLEKNPISKNELASILSKLNIPAKDLIRKSEAIYKQQYKN